MEPEEMKIEKKKMSGSLIELFDLRSDEEFEKEYALQLDELNAEKKRNKKRSSVVVF